jgi:hypothetical protein
MRQSSLLCAVFLGTAFLVGAASSRAVAAEVFPNSAIMEPPANAEKIEVDKLPKVVVNSVKKAMPGARITKAAKVVDDGKTLYYLDDVKVGKVGWDVTVSADGKILKKEECHDE